MFQIVRLELDDNGEVAVRRPLQPLFELREDAMAMAEFDASRLWGDYGCDEARDCWWATDAHGRKYGFVVETVPATEVAAWYRRAQRSSQSTCRAPSERGQRRPQQRRKRGPSTSFVQEVMRQTVGGGNSG